MTNNDWTQQKFPDYSQGSLETKSFISKWLILKSTQSVGFKDTHKGLSLAKIYIILDYLRSEFQLLVRVGEKFNERVTFSV